MRRAVIGLGLVLGCSEAPTGVLDAGPPLADARARDAAATDADAGDVSEGGVVDASTHDAGAVAPSCESAPFCRGAWCWAEPCVTGNVLSNLSVPTPGFGIAVGRAGTAMLWDGQTWRGSETGSEVELTAVFAASSTVAFAVGEGGTILRWDGARWIAEPSGTPERLLAVWSDAGGHAVAVGERGVIAERIRGAWTSTTIGREAWRAVDGSRDEVWIAGEGLFRRSAQGWLPVSSQHHSDVSVAGPSDVWAASGGIARFWDGAGWSEAPRPVDARFTLETLVQLEHQAGGPLHATFLAANWFAMVHLRYESGAWHPVPGDPNGERFTLGSGGEVWALSSGALSRPLLRGASSLHVFAGDDVWLAYHYGVVDLLFAGVSRFSGGRWSSPLPEPGLGHPFHRMHATGPDDVWLIAATGVARWDGSAWAVFRDRDLTFSAAWQAPGGPLWTASRAGIRTWDGSAWSAPEPALGDVRTLFGSGSSDLWAAGAGGQIHHWDGASWSPVASPTSAVLERGVAFATDDAWLVGAEGTILRWNGASWSAVPSGVTTALRSVAGSSSGDLWIGGEDGTLLRWDGAALARAPRLADTISDLALGPDGRVWAVGGGLMVTRTATSGP